MSTEEIKEYIGTQLKALTSIASPTGFTKNASDEAARGYGICATAFK